MTTRRQRILWTSLIGIFFAVMGFAETKSAPGKRSEGEYVIEKRADGTTVKYKKKTTYDFEGVDIEGMFKRPSGSYISNIKGVKGKSIIRVRKNFDAEVIDSGRMVK